MLLDRSQFKLHFPFALSAILLLVCGTVWYVAASVEAGVWLGGGSTPGLVCGFASGLIIFSEMLLWPRKALRRWRLFPTKYWMAAHLWLGVVCLPLAVLHSGFHLGGYLPATLMILLGVAYFSGIYGWLVQNILPRWMLRNLPGETIYSQIDHVSALAVDDIRRLITTSCGSRPTAMDEYANMDFDADEMSLTQTIVIGAVRKVGKTGGRTLQTRQAVDGREDRRLLWSAYDNIEAFLLTGAQAASPVNDRREASIWFDRLRRECSPPSHSVVEVFEQACEQRRQFDTQATVHRWLHGWLPLHVGVSIAVSVLLIAHIWTALKYW